MRQKVNAGSGQPASWRRAILDAELPQDVAIGPARWLWRAKARRDVPPFDGQTIQLAMSIPTHGRADLVVVGEAGRDGPVHPIGNGEQLRQARHPQPGDVDRVDGFTHGELSLRGLELLRVPGLRQHQTRVDPALFCFVPRGVHVPSVLQGRVEARHRERPDHCEQADVSLVVARGQVARDSLVPNAETELREQGGGEWWGLVAHDIGT